MKTSSAFNVDASVRSVSSAAASFSAVTEASIWPSPARIDSAASTERAPAVTARAIGACHGTLATNSATSTASASGVESVESVESAASTSFSAASVSAIIVPTATSLYASPFDEPVQF
ncbi:hypothetical protein [Cryobacterium sp. TMT2-15-1]|uniref:hypothetical protein n=1 Tax=Cryobacterium sp. TMT2-15-1 TaxID=1259246 RepID=UPI001F53F8D2|nr:hypothetical protein [Cryobacterium sp. TMT2-15-1]